MTDKKQNRKQLLEKEFQHIKKELQSFREELAESRELTADEIPTSLEQSSLQLLETVAKTQKEMERYFDELLLPEKQGALEQEVRQKLHSYKRAMSNLMRAYHQTFQMNDELSARWKDLQKSRKPHKIVPAAPANSVIDLTEQKTHHFTQGLNGYKLLWICYIGSFAGVVVESLWCLLQNGYLESRAGLVYGPFNLLYGAGAVALTAALYRFRNHGRWLSFLGGMTVGSAVEYLCSLGQEMLFGSRSWDYSNMPFNLNGRICLLYSAFWGALGVLWVKNIYPRMAKWILKLPEKQGKILTWALAAFFVFNAAVSLVAVYRWSGRLSGAAAANAFWRLIDTRFPDARMERIFANMVF